MKISVVIAVHNEERHLKALLDALCQQTQPADEVIFVDDESTDGTEALLRANLPTFPALRYIQQKNAGPAVARNRGWRASSGDVVVFTDGDCLPNHDWIQRLVQPLTEPTVGAVGGTYRTENTQSVLARFVGDEIAWRYSRIPSGGTVDVHGSYNFAVRKSVLEEFGGFSELYPKPSGEDFDLTFKISRQYKIIFVPEAIVGHYHPENFWPYMKNQARRAFDRVRLYRDHPEKRSGDSYSGSGPKYQVLLAGGAIALVPFTLFVPVAGMIFLFALLAILLLSADLFQFLFERDFKAALLGIPVVLCRSFAWFIGLAQGFLHSSSAPVAVIQSSKSK